MKSRRQSTTIEIWMESGYYRSPVWGSSDIDEVRKKFGVESSMVGRSLEGIRRIVDHYRKSADSEVKRAFGAAR